MAIEPVPNNGTQIERAIRAYFISLNDPRAGSKDDIFVTNDFRTRAFPLTDIFASRSSHQTENSGNEVWDVTIQNKFSLSTEVNPENPEAVRVAMDERVGIQQAALAQTEDGATTKATAGLITAAGRSLATETQRNNADMAQFTCLFVRFLGSTRGHPQSGDGGADVTQWVEARNYEITACPVAIIAD